MLSGSFCSFCSFWISVSAYFAWFCLSICCISRPLESRLSTLELQLREARETESPGAQRLSDSDRLGAGRSCEGRLRSRAWPRWNASCGRDRTDLFRHPTECHRMPQNATEGQLDMSVIATCNDRQAYCMYGWTKQRHQRHSEKGQIFWHLFLTGRACQAAAWLWGVNAESIRARNAPWNDSES